ncbi:MAG: 30S ribosomal protein S3 [Candidatus Norongarragalinales archaeon]
MAVEKKFLKKSLNDLKVKRFLFKELERASVSKIEIQKTPIATRIMVEVRRPGVVVGKKGKSIKDLCNTLERDFAIENPQIEVIEVAKPALDARLMAEKIARRIETKPNIKPIMRMALQEIMGAGALGAEIRVAGKVVGKGGKAKTFSARAGFLKKSGDQLKLVDEGHYTAYLSAGAVGIRVKIVPPGTVFYDKKKIEAAKAAALAEKQAAEAAAAQSVVAVEAEETAQ